MEKIWLAGTLLSLFILSNRPATAADVFTGDERARLVSYWNTPGRYFVGLAIDPGKPGPWQVRLTPEASIWFLAYQRAVNPGRLPPTVDAGSVSTAATASWEEWVRAKLDHDRVAASSAADTANHDRQAGVPADPVKAAAPAALPPATSPGTTTSPTPSVPPVPGLIPDSLLQAVGNPPPFAEAAIPRRYTVTFDDGEAFTYDDHVRCRPRFAYYRFPQGVIALGPSVRSLPDSELDPLFAAAGMNPSEARIARAVSRLEGGFESVNTYDTGYISIGFIQFITGAEGNGSLLQVLAREKTERPADFENDFARFGINVGENATLVVVDPDTGAELSGAQAVQKTIADKRLTAPFQRAGRHSAAFRTAQIEMAKAIYWPARDPVTVTIGGAVLAGKISDVIHSEAGMATLFDRKVNTGTTSPINNVVARVMMEHHLATLSDTAPFEREIISDLKYRADFLADPTLSQPGPLPPPAPGQPGSAPVTVPGATSPATPGNTSPKAPANTPGNTPANPSENAPGSAGRATLGHTLPGQ